MIDRAHPSLSGAEGRIADSFDRPLTESEQRMLASRLKNLGRRGRTALSRAIAPIGIVSAALWLVTLIVSDIHWPAITIFWFAFGTGMCMWVWRSEATSLRSKIASIESAIRRNAASVQRVRSSELVEIEEREDEGACWLFQLPDDQILVLNGQEYYATATFPNDDFSLVQILREDGRPLEQLIEVTGKKLAPSRKLAAEVRRRLSNESDLQVLRGSLRDLDAILGKPGA
jgi:hypothetical protein